MEESLTGGADSGAEKGEQDESQERGPHLAFSLSRRIRIIGLMCWGFMSMLMLRGVPSFAMQGAGGVVGMGDALNFSNTVKGNIYAAWGWGYTFTQMPGGMLSQIYGPKK